MPRSVIWSPSQTRNIVPAVSVMTVSRRNPRPGSETSGTPSLLIVSMMPGKNGFDSGLSKESASRYP